MMAAEITNASIPRRENTFTDCAMCKPVAWLINGLRSFEKIPEDWKNHEWSKLAMDIGKFFLTLLIVVALATLATTAIGMLPFGASMITALATGALCVFFSLFCRQVEVDAYNQGAKDGFMAGVATNASTYF